MRGASPTGLVLDRDGRGAGRIGDELSFQIGRPTTTVSQLNLTEAPNLPAEGHVAEAAVDRRGGARQQDARQVQENRDHLMRTMSKHKGK